MVTHSASTRTHASVQRGLVPGGRQRSGRREEGQGRGAPLLAPRLFFMGNNTTCMATVYWQSQQSFESWLWAGLALVSHRSINRSSITVAVELGSDVLPVSSNTSITSRWSTTSLGGLWSTIAVVAVRASAASHCRCHSEPGSAPPMPVRSCGQGMPLLGLPPPPPPPCRCTARSATSLSAAAHCLTRVLNTV